jgi:hypothetical protein
LNRFDADTKMSFLDLYTKLDAEVNKKDEVVAPTSPSEMEEIPF